MNRRALYVQVLLLCLAPWRIGYGQTALTPVVSIPGGGHDSPPQELTTTHRGRDLSRNYRSGHHNIGFRCARP